MATAVVIAFGFLGWIFAARLARVSRELDQTKRELAAANKEVTRLRGAFAEVGVLHSVWGLGAEFAASGSGVCRADDDKTRVYAATAAAIEMWSDSTVRSEIDLEHALLPALTKLREQGIQVVGAHLPPGVVAQYKRFRREEVGDVVMLDPSRIVDSGGRAAALQLLRKVGEGQMDPALTSIVYRFDQYGRVTYPLVQGPSEAPLLTAKLSDEPLAQPVTIAAADYPCS
jgi:hypothetical protein